jgi:uncharacterized protein
MVTLVNECLIRELNIIVETACKQPANVYGYGIWTHHIIHVVKYAKILAEHLGADKEIVEIAAILHDYAGIKDQALEAEHHIHGARLAGEILENYGYSQEKIAQIKQCIERHRGSVRLEQNSPEVICVTSADGMTHIDQALSLLYMVYKERGMDIETGRIYVKEKIQRTWNKLCPEAQKIMKEKYKAVMKVLE